MHVATNSMSALKRITFARSCDPSKPALNGMVLESAGPGKVYAAATNAFILAWGILTLDDPRDDLGGKRLIIPGKLADEIGKIRLGRRIIATLEITDEEARLQIAGLPSRTMPWVTGSCYPAWEKVIPKRSEAFKPLAGVRFQSGMLDLANKALGENAGFLHSAVMGGRNTAIAAHDGVFVQLCPIVGCSGYEESMITNVQDAMSAVPLWQTPAA